MTIDSDRDRMFPRSRGVLLDSEVIGLFAKMFGLLRLVPAASATP
jgi:hypothetical protein